MSDHARKDALASAYNSIADDFERFAAPQLRPLAKRLLQFIDLRPGWGVLDVGTGTGVLALQAAARVGKAGKIIGIDPAEQMLARARVKAAQFGFTQCQFQRGDADALEFPAASFHVVLSQFALHHVDLPRALAEIYRVLEPGGWLVFQDWGGASIPVFDAFYQTVQAHRNADAPENTQHLRAQAERARQFYQVFGNKEGLRAEVMSAGYANSEIHAESPSARVADADAFIALARTAPLASAEIAAMSPAARAAWNTAAHAALEKFLTPRGIEWNYPTLAVIAQK